MTLLTLNRPDFAACPKWFAGLLLPTWQRLCRPVGWSLALITYLGQESCYVARRARDGSRRRPKLCRRSSDRSSSVGVSVVCASVLHCRSLTHVNSARCAKARAPSCVQETHIYISALMQVEQVSNLRYQSTSLLLLTSMPPRRARFSLTANSRAGSPPPSARKVYQSG